jgi:archaellum component FlaG (FlaF/FlaG flagellin family)
MFSLYSAVLPLAIFVVLLTLFTAGLLLYSKVKLARSMKALGDKWENDPLSKR